MSLYDVLRSFWRRWWLFPASILITTILVSVVLALRPSTYTATVTLFVQTSGAESSQDRQVDNLFAQSRASTYAALASSSRVLSLAARKVNASDASVFAGRVTSLARSGTNLIDISVTANGAVLAANRANAISVALSQYVAELENSPGAREPRVSLLAVQPALPPLVVTGPRVRDILLTGVTVGVVIAALLSIALSALSRRVESMSDLVQLARAARVSVSIRDRGQEGAKDNIGYQLLTLLHGAGRRGHLLLVADVSSTGRRKPPESRVIAEQLRSAADGAGLSAILVRLQERTAEAPAYEETEVGVMLRGAPTESGPLRAVTGYADDPVLYSPRAGYFFDELAAGYNVVIVDSDAAAAEPAVSRLLHLVDTAILVVRGGSSHKADVAEALLVAGAAGLSSVQILTQNLGRHAAAVGEANAG